MNELSHLIPARHSIGRQGIDEQAEALVAQILPDEHIDPFRLYPSAQVGPIVLSVPHGGWQYPKSLVTTDNLERCISLADTGTAELGTMLAGGNFPVLIASCSRAVCDLNRPKQALDKMLCTGADTFVPIAFKSYVAAGYGVIPRLSADKLPLHERILDKVQWQKMLDLWHTPYHQKLTDLLRLAHKHNEHVFLIDLHSMPDNPERPSRTKLFPLASRRLPDFVFGNHHGATLTHKAARRIDRVMSQTEFSWHWNTPYAGGYITRHYGLTTKEDCLTPPIEVLQIEVNRRLYKSQINNQQNAKIMTVKHVIEKIVTALTDQ